MEKFELTLDEAVEIAEEMISRYTCGDCSKVIVLTRINSVDYRRAFHGLKQITMIYIVAYGECPTCHKQVHFYPSEYQDSVLHRRRLKARQTNELVKHLERCLALGESSLDHD